MRPERPEDRGFMRDASSRAGVLVALFGAAVLAVGCVVPAQSSGGKTAVVSETKAENLGDSPAETEAALAVLERMSAFLASRDAFRFRAEVHYDAVQDSGQRVEFGESREILVRRPDRLRIDSVGWEGNRVSVSYDGKEVWIASPTRRAYSRMQQTGGLEQVLERLATEYDSPTPFAELIGRNLLARISPSIEQGMRVGLVRLDGRLCEQLAFRAAALDFQLFVEQGETPVPRRLVIDYREEPGRPQFRASLGDWDLDPELPDSYFRVSPPIGAQRVPFDELLELMLSAAPEQSDALRGAP
jgi:hypothetical protein